mmetsp:Transcript_24507/g.43386  ORF Transcript_24507/g.43386 Transcript_24507/m.43386 type:complete len:125 (+) Transcript_24507:94-468(+)
MRLEGRVGGVPVKGTYKRPSRGWPGSSTILDDYKNDMEGVYRQIVEEEGDCQLSYNELFDKAYGKDKRRSFRKCPIRSDRIPVAIQKRYCSSVTVHGMYDNRTTKPQKRHTLKLEVKDSVSEGN